jgi:hypothetical protein
MAWHVDLEALRMTETPASARPFSLIPNMLLAGIVNAIINGGTGWLVLARHPQLSVWGFPGVALDTIAMAFGIGFGTALVVTPQTRSLLLKQRLATHPLSTRFRTSFEKWPRSILRRSLNVGVVGVIVFAPWVLLWLWAASIQVFDRSQFALLKGLFGFVEGALVTPLVVVAAMVDTLAPDSSAPASGMGT